MSGNRLGNAQPMFACSIVERSNGKLSVNRGFAPPASGTPFSSTASPGSGARTPHPNSNSNQPVQR